MEFSSLGRRTSQEQVSKKSKESTQRKPLSPRLEQTDTIEIDDGKMNCIEANRSNSNEENFLASVDSAELVPPETLAAISNYIDLMNVEHADTETIASSKVSPNLVTMIQQHIDRVSGKTTSEKDRHLDDLVSVMDQLGIMQTLSSEQVEAYIKEDIDKVDVPEETLVDVRKFIDKLQSFKIKRKEERADPPASVFSDAFGVNKAQDPPLRDSLSTEERHLNVLPETNPNKLLVDSSRLASQHDPESQKDLAIASSGELIKPERMTATSVYDVSVDPPTIYEWEKQRVVETQSIEEIVGIEETKAMEETKSAEKVERECNNPEDETGEVADVEGIENFHSASLEENFIHTTNSDVKHDIDGFWEERIENHSASLEENFIHTTNSDVKHDIDGFWEERAKINEHNALNSKIVPKRRVTYTDEVEENQDDDLKRCESAQSIFNQRKLEKHWILKLSMAKWAKGKKWHEDIKWLQNRPEESLIEVNEPEPLNAVEAADRVDRVSLRRLNQGAPGTKQWKRSYKRRTAAHPGFMGVDVYSMYEASLVVCDEHYLDALPWEQRDVKQRFLFEQSVSFRRNWFGRLTEQHGNENIRQPVCRPKSMEMPIKVDEWTEEWLRKPWDLPIHQVLSGSAASHRIRRDDDSKVDDPPECGEIRNFKLRIGERISRVTPDLTSSLRNSRWRKKYFPGGTFPF